MLHIFHMTLGVPCFIYTVFRGLTIIIYDDATFAVTRGAQYIITNIIIIIISSTTPYDSIYDATHITHGTRRSSKEAARAHIISQ